MLSVDIPKCPQVFALFCFCLPLWLQFVCDNFLSYKVENFSAKVINLFQVNIYLQLAMFPAQKLSFGLSRIRVCEAPSDYFSLAWPWHWGHSEIYFSKIEIFRSCHPWILHLYLTLSFMPQLQVLPNQFLKRKKKEFVEILSPGFQFQSI